MRIQLVLFLIVIALCAAGLLIAQMPTTPDPATAHTLNRGEQIASAVGTVTSTAISPLVGVCALGIWEWWQTPEAQRATLPFYALPIFWIPVSIILLLIFLKDTIGAMFPFVTKPIDALEVLFVNKAAMLMVAFPVVFHQVAQIFGKQRIGELFASWMPVVHAAQAPAVSAPTGWSDSMLAIALVAAGAVSTFVVWMLCQALDVLVLLSPFPFLDLILKLMRIGAFAALAAITAISPNVSLVISLIVIVIALLLAGWAYRLMVFGTVVSWDILKLLSGERETPRAAGSIRAFTERRIHGLPKRTYGQLKRGADGIEFRYRRFFLLRESRMTLPKADYEVGRGLVHAYLIEAQPEGRHRTLFRLAPRYGPGDEALREFFGVARVRDIRWGAGVRDFWQFLTKDEPVQNSSPG
ncbi:MAG: hypothetical protein K2X35_18010 [Bryobacteraceae bacterium]|nr:hypothetical protein [Bryobacteraceae bacterium]